MSVADVLAFSQGEKIENIAFLVLFRLISGNTYRSTVSAVLLVINFVQLMGFVMNEQFQWLLPDEFRAFIRSWQLGIQVPDTSVYAAYWWPCVTLIFLAVVDVVIVGVYSQSAFVFPTKFLRIVRGRCGLVGGMRIPSPSLCAQCQST